MDKGGLAGTGSATSGATRLLPSKIERCAGAAVTVG